MGIATSTIVPSPTASFMETPVPLLLVKSHRNSPQLFVLPAIPSFQSCHFAFDTLLSSPQTGRAEFSLPAALRAVCRALTLALSEGIDLLLPTSSLQLPKLLVPRDQFATEIIHLSLQDLKSRLHFCSQSLEMQAGVFP